MTELTLTRDRRDLLRAIGVGRVRQTLDGKTIRRTDGTFNRRCDSEVRRMVTAGLAVLGGDGGTYELTDAGRTALAGGAQ